MANVSLARVNHLLDKVKSLQASKKNAIQHAKRGVVMVADSAVIGVGAFGFGVAQGRFGEKKVLGIPVELVGAAAFHGAALMDVGGKEMTRQFHNLGNGALAAFVSAVGRGVGKRMRSKAGLPSIAGIEKAIDEMAGEDRGGGMQDDEQLARLARRL